MCVIFYYRNTYLRREHLYEYGIEKLLEADYQEAKDTFNELGDYKNSPEYVELATNSIVYESAMQLFKREDYKRAYEIFSDLGDFQDSQSFIKECNVKLLRLQQATTISAGIRSSAGVVRNGKVYFAGDDYYSWKSELDSWNDIVSISVKGNFLVGLKDDGTVVTAGQIPGYYVGTKTWSDIIAISTGQQHIIGLKSDGTVVAQGYNGDGQVNIDNWHDIVDIATGWRHTVGLDSNGDIYITGYGSEKQLKVILDQKDDWKDIIAIDAGGGSSGDIGNIPYTVALRKDGTVISTLTGEIADNISGWKNIIAISAGDSHIVGLKADGTVVTTQQGQSAEEISGWTDIVAVSAGYGFTLGLKVDGSVVAVGYNHDGQIDVDSWENITIYENGLYDLKD